MAEDEEPAKDSLGVVPTPMTGGVDSWRQFGTNAAHVRAAFKSSFGIKVHHSTMNSELYNSLFSIEGRMRIEQVVEKEKAVGITRFTKITRGEATTMVYMSMDDEKNKRAAQTLDESREARAAAVNISADVMAKLDTFVRLSMELDKVAKDLHKVTATQPGVVFQSLQVFEDLQTRADTRKKEKDESDPIKLTELKNASEIEKRYCEQRLDELQPKQQALPKEIEKLKEVNRRLDLAIKTKLASDQEEEAANDLLMRRANRTKIQDKVSELAALDATIDQVQKDLVQLTAQIKEYETAMATGGATPAKRQKMK
jgi:hypothetical protein